LTFSRELCTEEEAEREKLKKTELSELLDEITNKYTQDKEVGRTPGTRRTVTITFQCQNEVKSGGKGSEEEVVYVCRLPKKELIGVGVKLRAAFSDLLRSAAERLNKLLCVVRIR